MACNLKTRFIIKTEDIYIEGSTKHTLNNIETLEEIKSCNNHGPKGVVDKEKTLPIFF